MVLRSEDLAAVEPPESRQITIDSFVAPEAIDIPQGRAPESQAETLRFADEIRRSDAVGLPQKEKVERRGVSALEKSIENMTAKELDAAALSDGRNRRLLERIAQKDEEGEDVVSAGIEAEPGDETVVNLIEKLKESLRGRGAEREPKHHRGAARRAGGRRAA